MHAGAGLRLGLALGLFLVGEHIGMAAPVAVVDGKRIAQEHALEPRIAFDLFLRQGLAAAVAAEAVRVACGGPLVGVVLLRPVGAPLGRIGVVSVTSTSRT